MLNFTLKQALYQQLNLCLGGNGMTDWGNKKMQPDIKEFNRFL